MKHEPETRAPAPASAARHTTNTDRDLDKISMPPMAAELQVSEIHHPDQASPVASGEVDATNTAGNSAATDNGTTANPVLANFWRAVRRVPNYLRLTVALAGDPRVPRRSKALLAVGGAYAVSPIDFVPGIIPVAGQLDDLYVLLTALRRALRSSPASVANEHLDRFGIKLSDLDADLAAVRALVRQAAVTSMRVGSRMAKGASTRLMAMASRSIERGRKVADNEPL